MGLNSISLISRSRLGKNRPDLDEEKLDLDLDLRLKKYDLDPDLKKLDLNLDLGLNSEN